MKIHYFFLILLLSCRLGLLEAPNAKRIEGNGILTEGTRLQSMFSEKTLA